MLGETIGAVINAGASLWNSSQNTKLQKQFAQNALQWKAADAEKAGISKIYAMGAPTHSFTPTTVGGVDFSGPGRAFDKAIAGQGGPGSTTTGKVAGISAAITDAQLDGLKLDNDIKRAELSSKLNIATQPGAGGLMDRSVTQGPGGVQMEKKISPSSRDQSHRSFGVSPEVDLYKTHSGYAPQVPQQLQEAFENDALGRWQWNIRNRLQPMWDMDAYGAAGPASPGKYWMYNPIIGQYVEYPIRGNGRPPMRSSKDVFDRLRR